MMDKINNEHTSNSTQNSEQITVSIINLTLVTQVYITSLIVSL